MLLTLIVLQKKKGFEHWLKLIDNRFNIEIQFGISGKEKLFYWYLTHQPKYCHSNNCINEIKGDNLHNKFVNANRNKKCHPPMSPME